ncbi:recombinase family protein [Jiangella rhizosphaerae]|uniref:recombinase family protein n=1 Tax=Jiangella rhizosphaerae TaxID=2293569 RepID=UPI0011C3F762|nr:recombinase family protein [Jiangella rhizosphaerae]
MRIAIYVRISDDASGVGRGVGRQRQDCLKLAEARGWTVVEVLEDNDLSAAGKLLRPGFERLLDLIVVGHIDGVVAWTWDRLERNRHDSLRLIDAGQRAGALIALVRGVDIDMSTPAGRLSADVLASVARHEIELKSDRQRRANAQLAAEGKKVGGRRSFGFNNDMTHRPDEADAVRWAYDQLLTQQSQGLIAHAWNSQGLLTPHGRRDGSPGHWRSDTLTRCLRKPMYAGLHTYKGQITGAAMWEPIVDEDTWRAAQAILGDPMRRTKRHPKALLHDVALCGTCNRPVTGGIAHLSRPNRIYRCRTQWHIGRKAEPIELLIVGTILDRLARRDAPDLLADCNRPHVPDALAEARRLRIRIDELADAYAVGKVTLSQMERATASMVHHLKQAERTMADATRVRLLAPLVHTNDVHGTWNLMPINEQRRVIGALLSIRILSTGPGMKKFDPASVEISWRQSATADGP